MNNVLKLVLNVKAHLITVLNVVLDNSYTLKLLVFKNVYPNVLLVSMLIKLKWYVLLVTQIVFTVSVLLKKNVRNVKKDLP